MAHIDIKADLEFDEPTLVEGLPGVGLVGKIATDHLVQALEMEYYGAVHCDGLPQVAVYEQGERTLRPPVRIYADEDRDLLALQSDIPVSPGSAPHFADCLVGFFDDVNALPLCLSGLPQQKEGAPKLYGVGTGVGADRLAELDIAAPAESGLISGPTGAVLAEAGEQNVDTVGLIVQANAKFPDPEAARTLLLEGIEPLADIKIDTDRLVEQAEEIAKAREQLAKRMQQADEGSTQAQPLGMYQ